MKTRKVGDTIHFISDNKVVSTKILGISTYEGVINGLNDKYDLEPGKIVTLYHYDMYASVNADDVKDSLSELQIALFGKTIKNNGE